MTRGKKLRPAEEYTAEIAGDSQGPTFRRFFTSDQSARETEEGRNVRFPSVEAELQAGYEVHSGGLDDAKAEEA